jgi:uroporphyrinogen decarboxylase
MTSHERFKAMYEHREADRVPMTESPWGSTVERWRNGGPAGGRLGR